MGDQDHDYFFSSIMLKNIDNQIPIAFDEATPSKTTTPTTKSPSSIIGKESYKDNKCDQPATNHLKQELLHEIKHYISCLQKDNKTDYMNEYIKAMQNLIASLKSEVNSNNNINNNNNNNNNIINRNNNNNNNDDDNNILHKTSNSPPNTSNNNNSSNVLTDIDNDNNNNINNNNNNNDNHNKYNDNNNKNSKVFSTNK